MASFFTWMIGKPVPLGYQLVMLTTGVAAIIHWSHLLKWFVEWWQEENNADR